MSLARTTRHHPPSLLFVNNDRNERSDCSSRNVLMHDAPRRLSWPPSIRPSTDKRAMESPGTIVPGTPGTPASPCLTQFSKTTLTILPTAPKLASISLCNTTQASLRFPAMASLSARPAARSTSVTSKARPATSTPSPTTPLRRRRCKIVDCVFVFSRPSTPTQASGTQTRLWFT